MSKEIVYWKMRNSELISIDDMDINHLRNVLKMIIKNRKQLVQKLAVKPKSSFDLNGDMANEFHESYLSDEDDDRFEDTIEKT